MPEVIKDLRTRYNLKDLLDSACSINQETKDLFLQNQKQNTNQNVFRGTHPIPLTEDGINFIRNEDYYVTWKADGTRYMLIFYVHGCDKMIYAVGRDDIVHRFEPELCEQLWKCIKVPKEEITRHCIFDAEFLYVSYFPVSSSSDTLGNRPGLLLIHDVLVFDGDLLSHLSARKRLGKLQSIVRNDDSILDKNSIQKNTFHNLARCTSITMLFKNFYPKNDLRKLIRVLEEEKWKGVDGLIFMSCDRSYYGSKDRYLLKWKHPEKETVDFLVRFERSTNGSDIHYIHYYCMEGNSMILYHTVTKKLSQKSVDYFTLMDNKIIECIFKSGTWNPLHIRKDKNYPNNRKAVDSSLQSIRNAFDEEKLMKALGC